MKIIPLDAKSQRVVPKVKLLAERLTLLTTKTCMSLFLFFSRIIERIADEDDQI